MLWQSYGSVNIFNGNVAQNIALTENLDADLSILYETLEIYHLAFGTMQMYPPPPFLSWELQKKK